MTEPRLLLLTVGGFGDRVGARLAHRYPGAVVVDAVAGTQPAAWPTADVLVVAAEYDHPDLFEAVERSAFAWRRPWFPVLLDHPYLRCGPVIVPSRTACHRCFRRRRRQHAKTPAMWNEYPPPALPGSADRVRGYADHHIGLAFGLAVQAVGDALAPHDDPPGGWVRTVGLADNATHRAGVVAVDGCDRCRPSRTERDWLAVARSVDALINEAVGAPGGTHGR